MKSVVVIGVSLTTLLFGQSNRGGISGTVTDQSGGVIAGAAIIITNVGTLLERKWGSLDRSDFDRRLRYLGEVQQSAALEHFDGCGESRRGAIVCHR